MTCNEKKSKLLIPASESFHLLKGSAGNTAEYGLGAFIPNMKGKDVMKKVYIPLHAGYGGRTRYRAGV
jgi:hypothetical protein